MTEDHQPSPSFPATGPTLESDDYVVYHGENTLAIYSTRNNGVSLDDKLNFTEKTLMIYAETVFLNSKVISVEGKNLGIFCNRLILSLDEACIDVSGANGTDGTEPGKKAGNGGSGGTIWLYVEEPTPNLRKNLCLKAYGGDGGRGAAGKPQGGEGGDGGACGVLKCYIGSTVLRYAERLYSVTTAQKSNWSGWVREVNETISKDVDALADNGFDKGTANSWKSTVTSTAGLLDAAEKLQGALGQLISDDPGRAPLTQETVDEVQRLLDSLGKMVKNQNGPGLPSQQDVALLVRLTYESDSFYGGAAAEKKLQGVLKSALTTVAALTPTASGVSPLLKDLQYISAMLHSFIDEEAEGFVDQVALLEGGKGGPGGSGPTPEIPSGKRGADQPDNMAGAQLVSLSSNKINRLVDQAIASPEQCQMILDAADNIYFVNDRSQFPRAMNMYTRLTRRLSFLDVLLNDKDGASAPLTKALQTLESMYKLTIAPVSQLDGIYQAARRRLNSIVLSQDLWGHSDTWVPRLSLAYYGDRTKTMIKDFKGLEATFREYSKKEQKERLTESQVNQAQLSNSAMIQAAQDSMLSISRRGGELEVAADKIALCRQLMATARKQLDISLGAFREKIQNHFSVSADTFMDALSTLSMAPEGFTAIVQAADVIHKSWTKIENDQGNLIKKDYIVKQIKACQGSFASLAKTYEDLDASELKVDDPGFAKIFTTADDLKKILDEFEEQVPADDVRTKLDAYLDVVQKRNEAVINYNGLIHSYLQLQRVVQGCKEESRQLGERALQLNPSLPAIYFWLKRLRGQNRLQILRELNNQARALAFWGPMPVDSVSFPPPGPITGYTELQSYYNKLVTLFQSSYDGFQAGGWSSWPADRKFSGEGISVPLSQGVLDNLKRERGGQGLGAHDSESFLTITPKSHTDFLDMANVRLTQVRVWLLGATVGTAQVSDDDTPRRALRVEITHCGDDTLWDPDGTPCRFRHAPVTMQFSYETSVFNASGGKRSGRPGLVYSRQDIEHDYTGGSSRPGATDKPPIGPFGDWKLEIRKDVNPGLNLQSVTAGWIEFCGRNKLATSPLRGV